MNTTYFLNCVSGNVFKTKTSPALPTAYYVGLSTATPTIAGTGAKEPAGSDYVRQALSGKLGAPTDGLISNTSSIDFPTSETNWGTVTHFVIYDAQTGGNLLMYGALTTPRTVEPDTIMTLKPGALKLSVSNP